MLRMLHYRRLLIGPRNAVPTNPSHVLLESLPWGWLGSYNKYLAWPLLGALLYLITGDWLWTLIVTVGVFPEFKLSWGWLLDMNRRDSSPGTTGYLWASDDPRWDIWYVKAINKLSGGDDYKGTFLRHLFVAPMFVGLWYFGYLAPLVAVGLTFLHAFCTL
jgi:hypothetical protein